MRQFYCFSILLVLHVFFGSEAEAICGKCQRSNNVVCHNENEFSLCVEGRPTESRIACPTGTICTDNMYVCMNSESGVDSSCQVNSFNLPLSACSVCASEGKVFACIDEITVAFCYGKDQPVLTALATCPPNTVCDLTNSKGFCTPQNRTLPSCRIGEELTITSIEEVSITNVTITTEKTTTAEETTATEKTTTAEAIITTEDATTTKESTTTEDATTTKESTTTEETTTTAETKTAEATTTTKESTTTEETTTAEATTTTEETTTTKETTTTAETTTAEATTTTEETTTTEPTTTTKKIVITKAPQDLKVYCGHQKKPGFYENEEDPTCGTFIYCVHQNNRWIGSVVYCEDHFPYFDSSVNECVQKKPPQCR